MKTLRLPLTSSLIILILCTVTTKVKATALQAVGIKNTLYDIPGLEGGRPLAIKSYPAIENLRSPLFEVYANPPYPYKVSGQSAVAVLTGDGESNVAGEILFLQKQPPAGPIFVRGNVTGLSKGKHGLHIHTAGDLREGCDKLGGHFNPYLLQHGGSRDGLRHVGDLGNIEAGDDGTAEIILIDPVISLHAGPRGVVGRAIVVTADPDDLGRGENANSVVDGNSGKALACGIISYVR